MRQEIIEILNKYAIKFSGKFNTKRLISLLKNSDEVNWYYISEYQKLSEEFIREFQNKVDWDWISRYQKLSEEFIREFQKKVNWYYISEYQKLSEEFIREFQNKVDWYWISRDQKLSEEFIREFQNKVDWNCISINQKLSEEFIREFQNKFDWYYISRDQKLSEEFIREFQNKVDWYYISRDQKLSEEFIREFHLTKPENNWLYVTTGQKLDYIKKNTQYEVIDNSHIIAYKSVRSDNYSCYNFQHQYLVGNTYTDHCDYNLGNENSFGLSAWTKEKALEYHDRGKLLKVKINVEDIGAIVHNCNKIRCSKLEVLEEIML